MVWAVAIEVPLAERITVYVVMGLLASWSLYRLSRRRYTIVELLCLAATVGILAGMTLPTIRSDCRSTRREASTDQAEP